MPVYYPLIYPDDSFTYTPIVYEDIMTIFSAYNVTNGTQTGDLFEMFTQVPYGLWIGYFVSFFAFVFISLIGSRILKQKYSSFWMTTCAFLDQDNFPTDSLFVSVLSTAVMTGMFFMMTYAGNSMSTDLVTVEKPVVITTYDQVIDRGIKTIYTKVLPEWERFSNAPPGSTEWKLFQNSYEASLTPSNADKFRSGLLNQEFIFVSRPLVAFGAALSVIGFPGWPKTGRAYVAPDPHAKKYTNVFVLRSSLKGTPAEKFFSNTYVTK